MKKICIVTGSRAEWGLMSRIARLLDQEPEFTLQILATNMHLSPEYGHTYREIEEDGFRIDKKVDMLVSGDSARSTVKSVGLGTVGMADALEDLAPDLLLVLGDRYEMLAAVNAALIFRIPVAHLHGGELTEGAYDDSIRHAITKMSHLHFTSTEAYRRRVIQMGEPPERVYNTGAVGIDNLRKMKLLDRKHAEKSIGGFRLDRDTWLVTYHPETLSDRPAEELFGNLLSAFERFPGKRIVFTHPNSDTGGSKIPAMISRWVESHPARAVAFTSLGSLRYLSVLKHIGGVVGNSSSGIIEAPAFGIPTVNIGKRQKGRVLPESVILSGTTEEEIADALDRLARYDYGAVVRHPYEKPDTAARIVRILRETDFERLIPKRFYDLDFPRS